jgi:hypothetical protein
VNVYETALPQRSAVVMWVVVPARVSVAVAFAFAPLPLPWSNGYGSPGATGLVAAVGVIRARRVAANSSERSPFSGTSNYFGSARYAPRSANEKRDASR